MAKGSSGKGNNKVNMSAEIRRMLDQYPHAQSKEIVAKLAGKGITVKRSLVYFIKSSERHKRRKAKRERVSETSRRTGTTNPAELVLHVKSLALEAGGIINLKQLVDALAE